MLCRQCFYHPYKLQYLSDPLTVCEWSNREPIPSPNRYEMWNMYIAGEVGGMGESLARLSEMVSAPEEKACLLRISSIFFESGS